MIRNNVYMYILYGFLQENLRIHCTLKILFLFDQQRYKEVFSPANNYRTTNDIKVTLTE